MPERDLRDILTELHEQLEQATELDEDTRAALRGTAEEIRSTIEGAGAEQIESGLRERLSDALARFEGSHPRLTESVKRLVDQLAELGI